METLIYFISISIIIFFFNKLFMTIKIQSNLAIVVNLMVNSLLFILGWKCVFILIYSFNLDFVTQSKLIANLFSLFLFSGVYLLLRYFSKSIKVSKINFKF